MAIPVYAWLTDDSGRPINGSVQVQGREGSIEVLAFNHNIELPHYAFTGIINGVRQHEPFVFEKALDSSSVYLYRAATSGRSLQTALFQLYRINFSGFEVPYFTILLEDVKVTNISPVLPDTKTPYGREAPHREFIALFYQKITWHSLDGNIAHSDNWDNR